MSLLDSLRIHAHIEEITVLDDAAWTEIKLKLVHREDVQGECHLSIWTQDASPYYLGQELCGVFSTVDMPCPEGLRVSAFIQKISGPLDNGRLIEIKLKQGDREYIRGECRLRVSVLDANHYRARHEVFATFVASWSHA